MKVGLDLNANVVCLLKKRNVKLKIVIYLRIYGHV